MNKLVIRRKIILYEEQVHVSAHFSKVPNKAIVPPPRKYVLKKYHHTRIYFVLSILL